VEEKFLMNRYQEWLNAACDEKWTRQQFRSSYRYAYVRRLAHLAGCFTLSLSVGVRQCLSGEKNGQDGKGKSKHPDQVASRFVPITHLNTLTHYSRLRFDARPAPQ
jgi:hypothetical protein